MKTLFIKSESVEAFERFLSENGGDVQQSYAWGRFQATVPSRGEAWSLAVMEDDRWVAGVTVVRQRLPLGLCWLGVARGPVMAKGVDVTEVWGLLLKEVNIIARREKAVFLRVELPLESPVESLLQRDDWRPAHAHYQPDWSLRVDLTLSEGDILAQMKQKGRYNIKVAEKNGVEIHRTHDPRHVSLFYQILKKTGGRDGFGIHSEDYYQRLVAAMVEGDWGALYLAEKEGVVVGGILATFFGGTATYFYGASDHEHRATMAPYLTQWTAMREAKARGFRWYDFLGVAPPDDPNHPWKGITEFKEKFGGERVHYPDARELVYKPFWYTLMRWAKRGRA